jgi:hypothetical protein
MLTMRGFAGAAGVAGNGRRIAWAARQALSLGAKAPELFNRFLTVSQSGLCRLTRISRLGKNCLLERA